MAMSPFDPFALARWDPWTEMTSLRDAMNRLMESSFVRPNTVFGASSGMNVPLDLTETDDAYCVEAHVPGMRPEDVQVSVHNNVVTLQGERHEQQERKDGGRRIYTEHRYGSFSRSFSLPMAVDADRARAEFHDGVLTLTLPKMEAARARRIPVGSGGAIEAPRAKTAEPTPTSGRSSRGRASSSSRRSAGGISGKSGTRAAAGRSSPRRTGQQGQGAASGEMLAGEGGGPAVHREPVDMPANLPEENRTKPRSRR